MIDLPSHVDWGMLSLNTAGALSRAFSIAAREPVSGVGLRTWGNCFEGQASVA